MTTGDVEWGLLPFIALELVGLACLFIYPSLAIWVPEAIGW